MISEIPFGVFLRRAQHVMEGSVTGEQSESHALPEPAAETVVFGSIRLAMLQ